MSIGRTVTTLLLVITMLVITQVVAAVIFSIITSIIIVSRITIILFTGLLSTQGEKSINLYFMMVPLRKKY